MIPQEKIRVEIVKSIKANYRPKSILNAALLLSPKELSAPGRESQLKNDNPASDLKMEENKGRGNNKPVEALPMEKKVYFFGITGQKESKNRKVHAHLVSREFNKALCSGRVIIVKEISMLELKDESGGKYELCNQCLKLYNLRG